MSETLTIRLPAAEKAMWERAAADAHETVADYVRNAVRARAKSSRQSPWAKHLGAVDVALSAPTNRNIRRSFADAQLRKKR